jgi:hypothetical protein
VRRKIDKAVQQSIDTMRRKIDKKHYSSWSTLCAERSTKWYISWSTPCAAVQQWIDSVSRKIDKALQQWIDSVSKQYIHTTVDRLCLQKDRQSWSILRTFVHINKVVQTLINSTNTYVCRYNSI